MGPTAKYRCGFYFEQLNIDDQILYRKIACAVANYKCEAEINEQNPKALHHVLMAVKYDNPEFFYWSLDRGELKDGTICFHYFTKDREDAECQVKKLREKRSEILKKLDLENKTTQLERLKCVYEYLVDHVEYAREELQKPSCYPWIYDIQGPMVKGRSVCLGIAMALKYLCEAIHIDTCLITGEADLDGGRCKHGWNLVYMDDAWFHLDATAEICERTKDEPLKYFMVKDIALGARNWPGDRYPEAV